MPSSKYLIRMILIVAGLCLNSCGGDKEVSTNVIVETDKTEPIIKSSSFSCSHSTVIRPQVDFLFLWDNSSSSSYVNEETREALADTINLISNRFDYRILVAPLIKPKSGIEASEYEFLFTDNPVGLKDSAIRLITPNDEQNRLEAFNQLPQEKGVLESGLSRVSELLSTHQRSGVFRKNAYHMVIVISNGDDRSWQLENNSPKGAEEYFQTQFQNLLNISNELISEQFRFISIVAHAGSFKAGSKCPKEGYQKGNLYIDMSKAFYGRVPDHGKNFSGAPDTYDICELDFVHLFDTINQTIQDIVIQHVYDHWPLAETSDPAFDPEKIVVTKNTGRVLKLDDMANGFKYIGLKQAWPTRESPSKGEPFSGHMIQLFGGGKVTFPECLSIKTQRPADYYGFIVIPKNPDPNSIKLVINGIEIEKSDSNGWQLMGYKKSQNIKVKSPTDLSPSFPAELKSGYVLKLSGSAVFSNGSSIEIDYRPASLL